MVCPCAVQAMHNTQWLFMCHIMSTGVARQTWAIKSMVGVLYVHDGRIDNAIPVSCICNQSMKIRFHFAICTGADVQQTLAISNSITE